MKKSGQNKKGAALVYLIFVFIFVTLITTAMFSVYSNNFKQSYVQQKTQQAYYAALGGIELATTALLMIDTVDTDGDDHSLMKDVYENYATNIANAPVLQDTVVVGEGKALITLKGVKDSGQNWVQIESIGIIKDMYGKEVKSGTRLKINLENQELTQWKTFAVD